MDWISSWKIETHAGDSGISPTHIHDRCELLFITEGCAKMHIGGREYVILPHQLAIIAPLELHDIVPTSFPYSRVGCHIDPGAMEKIGIPPLLSSLLTIHPSGWVHIFDLTEHLAVEEMILQMSDEINSDRAMKKDMIATCLHLILLKLYRLFPDRFEHRHTDNEMENAKLYIEDHCTELENIGEIASTYYLTPSHFIVRFKKYTGYTPYKFRNVCRIALARQLLTDNTIPLTVIAEKCGFSDLNGFVRSFRQMMNISPGQFRRLSANLNEKM